MSAVAVVAIVMAVGEAKAPTTAGLLAAAQEAFVPGTAVRVSEVPFPSDDAALVWENELDARAAITLTWEDPARLHAHIRMHVARTDRWTDREIRFAPADTPRERGRTLGFAIASMWPDQAAVRTPPPPPAIAEAPPPRRLAERAEPEPAPNRESDSATEAAADVARAADEVRPPRTKVPPGPPLPPRALGLAALIAEGIQGPAQGFGGSVDGALFLDQSFALRLGVTLRTGSVEQSSVTDVVGAAAIGVEWWPLPPSTRDTLGFGLRADALLLRHQVFDSGDNTGRFMPGADVVPMISVRVGDTLEILLGAGAEVAFGTTEIRKDGTHVATVPALRVMGHAGVRLRF